MLVYYENLMNRCDLLLEQLLVYDTTLCGSVCLDQPYILCTADYPRHTCEV